MDDENRKSSRRRQLKAATIAFNNRHSTMPCVVREISDDGARIEGAGNMVPDTFELLIELDGLEAQCQVAWRRTNEVGVAFLAPPVRKAPRRAQVVDAVRGDKTAAPSLRKKPLVHSPHGVRDIPPPPADVPPPAAEPSIQAPVTAPEPPVPTDASATGAGPAQVHERAAPLSQRRDAPSPQPASPAPPPRPAPAPIRLGLPPAGNRFPKGARFDLKPVSGLPPAAESAFHAAVTAALRARGLAADPGQPAPYSLTGLLSANRAGDTVTFAYLFDVTNRSGRPLHRIAGQETVNLYRERAVWNPIEGELSKRIAAIIADDLASQIGDAT